MRLYIHATVVGCAWQAPSALTTSVASQIFIYGKLYIDNAKVAIEGANGSSSDKIGRVHYKRGNVYFLLLLLFFGMTGYFLTVFQGK